MLSERQKKLKAFNKANASFKQAFHNYQKGFDRYWAGEHDEALWRKILALGKRAADALEVAEATRRDLGRA